MSVRVPPSLRGDPLFLTTRAALELTARCKKALRDAGIDDVNPAQASILMALDNREDITPTQLAQEVMYEKSTLTPLLERLENAGLLARTRDAKDGRVQRMTLTRKGQKRRKEIQTALSSVSSQVSREVPKKVLRHHVEFCQTVLDIPK